MNYQPQTHCPNCFSPSTAAICSVCHFDRDFYYKQRLASHYLPLFSVLEKGYTIGCVLGEGSLGIVYAAIRQKDQLQCVIKEYFPHGLVQRGLETTLVLPKTTADHWQIWQNRFSTEAELLRSCYDHPSVVSGIVRYMGLIKQHNTVYLVMERLYGKTLNQLLQVQKRLSPEMICHWLQPVLKTLQRLHDKEIYHRHLSTQNIFLQDSGEPVLMDFALNWEEDNYENVKLSTFGINNFSAPEQLTGRYEQRTDLYALGVIIYRCLQGRIPPSIEARRQNRALFAHIEQADKITLALQSVAEHCLHLEINQRPKDALQLLMDLSLFWKAAPAKIAIVEEPPVELVVPPSTIFPTPPSAPRYTEKTTNVYHPPAKPRSIIRGVLLLLFYILLLIGLTIGGFFGYQFYDTQETEKRKQDNLLFSQAHTLEEYQKYLTDCITCESKQRAQEQIAALAQEQQLTLKQQKLLEQEAFIFNKAQTVPELTNYLETCVLCANKDKAQSRLDELTAASQLEDEKQLAETETAMKAALQEKGSTEEFYQQNCPQNLPFWQRAAEQGMALAQFFVGHCYQKGLGVKQEPQKALKWYLKAAELGYIQAQYELAQWYQKGLDIKQSDTEAFKWYLKAAEQGLAEAQYSVGFMYEKAQGTTQDYKEALAWYMKAANQNHSQAQYQMGSLYHYGTGVEQDYQAALAWYKKAADQNNAQAQYLIGVMYENGYGVTQDTQEALNWYQKAALQGNQEAMSQITVLETQPAR